jgi:hypothetical protein
VDGDADAIGFAKSQGLCFIKELKRWKAKQGDEPLPSTAGTKTDVTNRLGAEALFELSQDVAKPQGCS